MSLTDEQPRIDCACPTQKPERRLFGFLSLLVCTDCERLILHERTPDRLSALEQDLAALTIIARVLAADRPAQTTAPRLQLVPEVPEHL